MTAKITAIRADGAVVMQEKQNLHEPVRGYRELHLPLMIRNEVEPALVALERAVSMLPAVDADGRSECPYAAQIYRQKDEAAKKVAQLLTTIGHMMETVEQEVARCRNRLEVIKEATERVHDPRTVDGCDSAVREAQGDVNGALADRQLLKSVAAKMEQALKYAAKLTYPGDSPREPAGGSMPYGGTTGHSRRADPTPLPTTPAAAQGIVSMGPRPQH